MLLFVYVVAALFFWGTSLQKQSNRIYAQEVSILHTQIDSNLYPENFSEKLKELQYARSMRTKQYMGEGVTFLLVILIGAGVVYTSFSRSIRLSRQQNNFMLSVTHELKSPLAAVKLNLQTMEKYQLTDEKKKDLLERSIKEANRLNDLCNNMLFASQLEGRQYQPAQELLDLTDLVEDSVDDYAARYPQRFEEDIESDCKVQGDKVLLQMAINNLLENAIKYTPADKHITIELVKKSNNAIIHVIDEGQGIPDTEKSKIFTKFYRIGSEESRKTKGTGLGLYLTRKIVQYHKGKICVKDNKPKGAVFEICLPLA